MKNLFYKITMILAVAALMTSCERELTVDTVGSTPPGLRIKVSDVNGSPVSGATVSLFNTLDGYITEMGAIGTATTDGNGEVAFDQSTLSERGVYYFNVASGTLRNWTSTVATNYLLLNDGETLVTTTLDEVPQAFIDLTTGTWLNSEYYYGATQANTPCESDDVLTFLKDGTLTRAHGASTCPTVSTFMEPISADGAVWSKWTVADGGATLVIRDLDPGWDGGSCNHTSAETGDCFATDLLFGFSGAGTVTIDYSGGGGTGTYRATLTAN